MTIGPVPGQNHNVERVSISQAATPENMQIFEGTNQIQRLVISRHLAS